MFDPIVPPRHREATVRLHGDPTMTGGLVLESPPFPNRPRDRNVMSYSASLDPALGPGASGSAAAGSAVTGRTSSRSGRRGRKTTPPRSTSRPRQTYVFFPDRDGGHRPGLGRHLAGDDRQPALLRQSSTGTVLRDGAGFCGPGVSAATSSRCSAALNTAQCPGGHDLPARSDARSGPGRVHGHRPVHQREPCRRLTPSMRSRYVSSVRRYEIAKARQQQADAGAPPGRGRPFQPQPVPPHRRGGERHGGTTGTAGRPGGAAGAARAGWAAAPGRAARRERGGMGGAGGAGGTGATRPAPGLNDCFDPNRRQHQTVSSASTWPGQRAALSGPVHEQRGLPARARLPPSRASGLPTLTAHRNGRAERCKRASAMCLHRARSAAATSHFARLCRRTGETCNVCHGRECVQPCESKLSAPMARRWRGRRLFPAADRVPGERERELRGHRARRRDRSRRASGDGGQWQRADHPARSAAGVAHPDAPGARPAGASICATARPRRCSRPCRPRRRSTTT